MNRIRQFVWLLSILFLVPPPFVAANALTSPPTPDVFITEIQTGNSTAGEEFIELYNNTDQEIDFAETATSSGTKRTWKLLYSSWPDKDSAPNWDKPASSIVLNGIIPARGYYLLSSSPGGKIYTPGSTEPEQTYSARLADSGGLKLVDIQGNVTTLHNRVGWFKSNDRTQTLAKDVVFAAGPRKSLQRHADADGFYLQENGDLFDMDIGDTITPKTAWQPDTQTADEVLDDVPPSPLQITELLPNPNNGAESEYIELYNSSSEPINPTGYTFKTASGYKYSIEGKDIGPGGYKAFYVGQKRALLANSGGTVYLIDPAGRPVADVRYEASKPGEAWAFIDGEWQWTTTPTPGEPNIFAAAAVAAATKKAVPFKVAAKPRAAKTAKAAKSKKSSTKAAKTAKPRKENAKRNSQDNPAAANRATPLHPTMLAAVAGLALVYGAYEYRNDFRNLIYRIRRYRAHRREAGQPV